MHEDNFFITIIKEKPPIWRLVSYSSTGVSSVALRRAARLAALL